MDRWLEAVLFDWDGTLVDSAAATFHSYVRLFGSYGIGFDRKRFEETYAPDWHQTYRGVGLPESLWPEADARWLALYARESARAVDGALVATARLAAAGVRQGLVTSGDRRRVEGEVKALGFDPGLAILVCAGEAARPKPAPEPLLLALERFGLGRARAAFVGDSPEDVQMARAAGVYAVGVPGGYPNRAQLAEARPDLLAGSLVEAVDHLLAQATPGRDAGQSASAPTSRPGESHDQTENRH